MPLRSTPESAFEDIPDDDYEPQYLTFDAPETPEVADVDMDPVEADLGLPVPNGGSD